MELLNPLSKADYPAYSVAYTGTAGNTSAWAPGAQGVVVWSDQACYVEVGVGAGDSLAVLRGQGASLGEGGVDDVACRLVRPVALLDQGGDGVHDGTPF